MVTACFNAEDCIEKTILSVLAQTKPVYEYIIIDGDSTDSTMSIVESYREKFHTANISFIIISEKDKGISDAFNKGIQRAGGDLVGLINANDELLPYTCQNLEYVFEDTVDVYYANCIWEEPNCGLRFVSKPKERNVSKLNKLLYEMVLIHPSTFITKRAYQKHGLYDVSFRYCMDQELLYRMSKGGVKFKYIDNELTRFRAGGVSDTYPRKVFKETCRIPLMYGELPLKVKIVEKKKLLRDFMARKAKRIGIYNIIKKKV
jgi:glycosyltransferase involved in cell wall biosynthesis